jgi:hypothetical protein
MEILPDYNPSTGLYCDADQFSAVIPCVNLSVGYCNAHTENEFLNIDEFQYINSKILKLNDLTGEFELYENSFDHSVNYCAFCGESTNNYSKVLYDYICSDCIYELMAEFENEGKENNNYFYDDIY